LKPDLVIGSVPYRAETIDAIIRRGLTFLAMTPRSLADIFSDIRLVGRLLGRERRAGALVREMKKRLARIAGRARGARRKPRVYVEIWSNPFIVAPRWVEEMVALAGGRLVPVPASEVERKVAEADVLRARPEVIVLAWAACGMRVNAKRVLARPRWQRLPAFRRRRVYILSDENLNTPGPPIVAGLERLARILHPEIFGPPEDAKVRQVA
jgi:iron complex transport system substrate-binding protein